MRNTHHFFLYRCAKQRHQLAKRGLERDRKAQEKEQKRKLDELMKKKREAKLTYDAKKRQIEMRNSDKQVIKAALERLDIHDKQIITAFDKELKDNEILWNETCIKYNEQSKDLKHRWNEYSAEMEKRKIEEQFLLAARERCDHEEQKRRHEEMKEEQYQRRCDKAFKFDLWRKEWQQAFAQKMEEKKIDALIEMEKEINRGKKVQITVTTAAGKLQQLRLGDGARLNPASIFQKIATSKHLAIESPPAPVPHDDLSIGTAGDREELGETLPEKEKKK